jgi:hypothetical protein
VGRPDKIQSSVSVSPEASSAAVAVTFMWYSVCGTASVVRAFYNVSSIGRGHTLPLSLLAFFSCIALLARTLALRESRASWLAGVSFIFLRTCRGLSFRCAAPEDFRMILSFPSALEDSASEGSSPCGPPTA